jgi:catechol 2,3-dioxygenase-like lactoylglutathione lyase family enzyme
LICREAERLAEFYTRGFGFVRTDASSAVGPAFAKQIGLSGGHVGITYLRLGEQEIALAQSDPPGRSYPNQVAGWDPLFQHFAIVVADMAAAYARLRTLGGWTAISTSGPQTLPLSSGAVTAFKFRDPEGHPLELLEYAAGAMPARWASRSGTPYLGIDHSAISVADTQRSVAFYGGLGLQCIGSSLNVGAEQEKLDDVAGAIVEVTALAPPVISTPHVELLCYRGDFDRRTDSARPNDVAAAQLVFEVESHEALDALLADSREAVVSGPIQSDSGCERAMLRDPDGHWLCLEVPPVETTADQPPVAKPG